MAKIVIKINHKEFEKILYQDDMKVVTAEYALDILVAAAEIYLMDQKGQSTAGPGHEGYLESFETEVRGKSVWVGNTDEHAFWVEFGAYLPENGWDPARKILGYAPLRRGLDVVASRSV